MSRILIIEDDHLQRRLLQLTLEEQHTVQVAENGQTGIDMALDSQPDIVLCDIGLPDIDGFGVLKTLRQSPATQDVSFIFMTAKGEYDIMRQAMILGADDYLAKPFSVDDLHATVRARLMKREIRARKFENVLQTMRKNITMSLPHELRTSIMVVEGYASLLQDDLAEDDTKRAMVDAIQAHAQRLRVLSDKFQWYSLTELLQPGHIVEYPVKEVAKTLKHIAVAMSEVAGRADDLTMTVEPGTAHISEDHFNIICRELIENAFKFSHAGTQVKVLAYAADADYVIQLSDEGRGFTDDQLQQVDAFMQFERDTYEQQGTGLGLAIAKRLVKIACGTLMISPRPTGGTLITIHLPAHPTDECGNNPDSYPNISEAQGF